MGTSQFEAQAPDSESQGKSGWFNNGWFNPVLMVLYGVIVAFFVLIFPITDLLNPALDGYKAADDPAGKTEALNELLSAAAWGAAIAAVGAAAGQLCSLFDNRFGYFARGWSVGAAFAVTYAAFAIAVATEVAAKA